MHAAYILATDYKSNQAALVANNVVRLADLEVPLGSFVQSREALLFQQTACLRCCRSGCTINRSIHVELVSARERERERVVTLVAYQRHGMAMEKH
jgi:hypothetical protein